MNEQYEGDLPVTKDREHQWEPPLVKVVIATEQDGEREHLGMFHELRAPPLPDVGQRLDFDRGIEEDPDSSIEWSSIGEFVVEDIEYDYGFGTYTAESDNKQTDRLFVNVNIIVAEK